MSQKVAFITLGCKLNFSESSTMSRRFEELGFCRVDGTREKADIYVINTCSVTDHADKKCRNIIRKIISRNTDAIIAVTGCYAQLKPTEIASIEGVDIVLGNNEKGELANRVMSVMRGRGAEVHTCSAGNLSTFFAAYSSGDRTRAFLKVQDGCSYSCTYCTIPLARGASRNISIDEIVGQASKIALGGQQEIVLTGVNVGDFGRTTGESFAELLRRLDTVEGINRYRISSIEPNLLTDEVIDICSKSKKFVPHFHIPLQSGSDKVLQLMKRRYNTSKFEERVDAVRKAMPRTFFGIDVIVGFPGETEQEFKACYSFLERVKPAFLHIFPYSERANTPAIEYEEKVSSAESARRASQLKELSDRLHLEFYNSRLNEDAEVLFEGTCKGGMMFGYSEDYIRIETTYNKDLINKLTKVRLLKIIETSGQPVIKASIV